MKIGRYGVLAGLVFLIAMSCIVWSLLQGRSDYGAGESSRGGRALPKVPEAKTETKKALTPRVLARDGNAPVQFRSSDAAGPLRVQKKDPEGKVHWPPSDPDAIPGELVLRFKNRSAMEAFLGTVSGRKFLVVGIIPSLYAVRLRGASSDDLMDLVGGTDPAFEHSPNYYAYLPNPRPATQPGQEPPGGYKGFGLDTMTWLGVNEDRAQWGQGVKVAVLDSGVGQCPAINESMVTRMDLVGEQSDASSSGNDHATAVAAILAGTIPGNEGMAPAVQIVSIKIVGSDGTGDSFTLAKGIEDAIAQNVQIISLSVGSRGDCPLVQQAVADALANGIAVVAAVGNDGAVGVSYPARYAGVLAVTAIDENRNHLAFANVGPEVGLAAPGYDVWIPYSTNTAIRFSGTSASVPFVSGTLASLLSLTPGLKPDAAVALLLQYSDEAGLPGRDPDFGNGIINPQRALNRQSN